MDPDVKMHLDAIADRLDVLATREEWESFAVTCLQVRTFLAEWEEARADRFGAAIARADWFLSVRALAEIERSPNDPAEVLPTALSETFGVRTWGELRGRLRSGAQELQMQVLAKA